MSSNCKICFNEVPQAGHIYKFDCKCECCEPCAAQHVFTEINKTPQQEIIFIKCPFGCQLKTSGEIIFSSFKTDAAQIVDDALFQNYCTRQKDVLKCPYKDCGYIGYYSEKFFCSTNVDCMICKKSWSTKQSSGFVPLKSVRTKLWTFLFTRQCPKCGSSIEKNGGCQHMTCACRHEFCWNCYQNWSSHSIQRHSRIMGLTTAAYLALLLPILYYLGLLGLAWIGLQYVWIGITYLAWAIWIILTSQFAFTNFFLESLGGIYIYIHRPKKNYKGLTIMAILASIAGYFTIPGILEISPITKWLLIFESAVYLVYNLDLEPLMREIQVSIGHSQYKGIKLIILICCCIYLTVFEEIPISIYVDIIKGFAYLIVGALFALYLYRTRKSNGLSSNQMTRIFQQMF